MATNSGKPSGTTGPFKITVTDAGAEVEWLTARFSSRKEEIEAGVVEGFLAEVRRQRLMSFEVLSAQQNPENDLDYTLTTSEGTKYLELMEVAPLGDRQGRYANATGAYKPYDLAGHVVAHLLKKSRRYTGVAAETPIILVVYNTHWAFNLGDTARMLLQYWAQATPHCFVQVYYYCPISERVGTAYDVYPTPQDHWAGFDPEVCRDDVAYNLIPHFAREKLR